MTPPPPPPTNPFKDVHLVEHYNEARIEALRGDAPIGRNGEAVDPTREQRDEILAFLRAKKGEVGAFHLRNYLSWLPVAASRLCKRFLEPGPHVQGEFNDAFPTKSKGEERTFSKNGHASGTRTSRGRRPRIAWGFFWLGTSNDWRGSPEPLPVSTGRGKRHSIPRANTIVINRADRMGLSELYQLRGRVGRSNQRAYAYLLVPPDVSLTPIARQRLAALQEFSDLGAGFRIAALDLELRGAGNLLGREQHGHIEAVGFDLYCQMMERAVAERKGEAVAPERRATLNLGQDVRIPPEYIESENLRLRIYKRVAGVTSETEREEVRRELEDRFGPPPAAVVNLLDYAVLKALAEKLQVASVDRRGDQVAIKFYDDTPLGPERIVKLIRKRRDMRLDPSGVLWLGWKGFHGGVMDAVRNVLLQLQS